MFTAKYLVDHLLFSLSKIFNNIFQNSLFCINDTYSINPLNAILLRDKQPCIKTSVTFAMHYPLDRLVISF